MDKIKTKIAAYMLSAGIVLVGCENKIIDIIIDDKSNDFSNDTSTSQATEVTNPIIATEVTETLDYLIESPDFSETESTIEMPKATIPEMTVPETTIPETTAPEETEEPTLPPPTSEMFIATADTTIYAGDSSKSLKIGSLEINDKVIKLLSSDNWTLVKQNDTIGYVRNADLDPTGEEVEIESELTLKNDIAVTTTALNFREEPTTESDIILTFREKTELEVLAEANDNWLLVRNNGILGYVKGDYTKSMLEKAQEQYPELELNEISTQKVVYSTTDLNFRTGPSTDYERIDNLERYETARVIAEYDDWYFVMKNEYEFGFINRDYTKDLDDTFFVIDKSVQRMYMYNDNQLYYVTPVTTGKDSTPSDTGLFKIYSKEKGRYLKGKDYKAWVDFWLPYNGGEGIHDATWRTLEEFGTQIYKEYGSHGCINTPPSIMDDIYEHASVGNKVLVHK